MNILSNILITIVMLLVLYAVMDHMTDASITRMQAMYHEHEMEQQKRFYELQLRIKEKGMCDPEDDVPFDPEAPLERWPVDEDDR